MSNMSYCRFRNTVRDLSDCNEALQEMLYEEGEPLSEDEKRAAVELVSFCFDITSLVAERLNADKIAEAIEDVQHRDSKIGDLLSNLNANIRNREQADRQQEDMANERAAKEKQS